MTLYSNSIIIFLVFVLIIAFMYIYKSEVYIPPLNNDSAILYFDDALAPYLTPEVIGNIQKGVSVFFSDKIQVELSPSCDKLPKGYHGLIIINFEGRQLQTPFGKNFNDLYNETRSAFGNLFFNQFLSFPS
jgi:hypothetical protein